MRDDWTVDKQLRRLRRRLWAERVVFLILLGLTLAWHFGLIAPAPRRACAIAVNGKPAVVVASRSEAQALLEQVKESSGLPGEVGFAEKVTLHLVPAEKHEVLSGTAALSVLSAKLQPVVEAAAIVANGKVVAGLPTRDEAVRALALILQHFSPPAAREAAAFKEQVRIETRPVGARSFFRDPQDALERIVEASRPKREYEVQPGDTGSRIALEAHVPLSRLRAANPGLNLDRLRAGDRLKIPGELPPLTVVARATITETLPSGRTQTVRVTYENGVEVERAVLRRGPRPRPPDRREPQVAGRASEEPEGEEEASR